MTDPRPQAAEGGAGELNRVSNSYLASTVKHGFIYFFGNVLGRIAGFVMLPVYTRVLTAADYGILEILALSTDVLGMLAGLGVQQAMLRFYYQYESTEERNGVVSTAAILVWSVFTVIAVVGLSLARPISDVLLGAGQPVRFVQLAVLSFALSALGDVPGVYLQARQQSRTIVLTNFVRLVISLSLNILFVVFLRVGVAGIFYSTILSSTVVGGFMAIRVMRETGVRFVPRYARELLGFGSPLVFSQIGSFILHFSDRYVLRHYHALAVVGLYSLSYKFAMLLAVFVSAPFHTIWNPKSLEIANREGPDAPPILRSILEQFNIVLVATGLGVALFATDVIHFVLGAEFRTADRAVPLLTVGIVLFGFRIISQTGAFVAKRSDQIAYVTSAASVLAVILNVLWIPRWGAMGAAAATAASFGAEFVTMLARSERVYPIGITLRAAFAPMGIAIIAWFAASLATPIGADPVVGFAIRVGAFAGFVLALVVSGLLTPATRQMIIRSVRDPRAMLESVRRA